MSAWRSIIATFAVGTSAISGLAQPIDIVIDGVFDDWEARIPSYDGSSEPTSPGLDFRRLWVTSSDRYLLFAVEVDEHILLQEANDLTLFLDTDADIETGLEIHGLGAELTWTFGNRSGTIHRDSGSQPVDQGDIGLYAAPSTTSNRFEFAVPLDATISGWPLFPEDTLAFLFAAGSNSSTAPVVEGGLIVPIDQDSQVENGTEDLKQTQGTLRLLTYNVLQDGLFDPVLTSSYENILRAIRPNLILFTEIYEHSASQTADRVEQFLPSGPGSQWHASSTGADIVLVSRYPVLQSFPLRQLGGRGNSAFLLDLSREFDNDLFIVGAHFACCSGGDAMRQKEADEVMAFIRDAKEDGTIPPSTPFVITGDLNLVGDRQQLVTLLSGDIVTPDFAPPFAPDWDGSDLADVIPSVTGIPITYTWLDRDSDFMPSRLDYMLYSDAVAGVVKSYVLDTRKMSATALANAGLRRADSPFASDHLAVVADFDFGASTGVKAEKPFELMRRVSIYPNPGVGRVNVKFTLQRSTPVDIELYDTAGRLVDRSRRGPVPSGVQTLHFDLNVPAGLYLMRLRTGEGSFSARMVVRKGAIGSKLD